MKNIYEEELNEEATTEFLSVVQNISGRNVIIISYLKEILKKSENFY